MTRASDRSPLQSSAQAVTALRSYLAMPSRTMVSIWPGTSQPASLGSRYLVSSGMPPSARGAVVAGQVARAHNELVGALQHALQSVLYHWPQHPVRALERQHVAQLLAHAAHLRHHVIHLHVPPRSTRPRTAMAQLEAQGSCLQHCLKCEPRKLVALQVHQIPVPQPALARQ